MQAYRKPALSSRTLHRAELTVCCCLIRFSWYRASCSREILRFSTLSWPEVQKRREADVDFQAVWAHVSNQEHQVSSRRVSDWWKKSVRKSVSVHQDKFWGSAIYRAVARRRSTTCWGSSTVLRCSRSRLWPWTCLVWRTTNRVRGYMPSTRTRFVTPTTSLLG